MGFSPIQVGELSLWQFMAAADGYVRAHGGDKTVEPPTAEEYREMIARNA